MHGDADVPLTSKAIRVLVRGRVQGVAFRHSTVLKAQPMGLFGWVRNLPDGTVEGFVQGDAATVDRLVDWMRAGGPPAASVDAVDVTVTAPDASLTRFETRR